jgi:post-segregation antitoxin (ccd killing protein)
VINRRGFFVIIVIALCFTATRARAADLPISCEQIRALVAEHGKARALAWAIENGYSLSMINEARKCLLRR